MYTTQKLNNHPYAQACIRHYDSGEIACISYETAVIIIDSDGWLSCTGTYSATTRKHIGYFLKELQLPLHYQTAKMLYKDNMKMNIYTGEVIPQ